MASQPICGLGNDEDEVGVMSGAGHGDEVVMRAGGSHAPEDEVEVVHLLQNVTQITRRQM